MKNHRSRRILITSLFLFGFLALLPLPARAEGVATTTESNLATTSTTTVSTATITEDTTLATVNLHLRYQDTILYDGSVTLPEEASFSYHTGDPTVTHTTSTAGTTALAVLLTADEEDDAFTLSDIQYYEDPLLSTFFVNCLTLTTPTTTDACYNWQYVVDGTYPDVGMADYILTGDETIHVYFGDRFRISSDVSRVLSGNPVVVTIDEYDFETDEYAPNSTETINWKTPEGSSLFSGAATAGQITVQPESPGTHTVGVGDYLWPNTSVDVLPTRLTVIENGTVIYDQLATLPTGATFAYTVSGSSTVLTTTTVGATVLALIAGEDAASTAFDVTLLEYYESFGSFYLNCIRGAGAEPSCDNWHYTVDGEHQSVGADQFTLSAGDHVHLYFGDRYRLRPDNSSIALGEEITAILEEFGTTANAYTTLADESLVALMDANGTVLATSTVGAAGTVRFTPTEIGTYTLALERITEDGWIYYETQTDSITVQSTTTTPESESITSGNSGNNSSGGGGPVLHNFGGGEGTYTATITHRNIDQAAALTYLRSAELEDGSFGSPLHTDWAALALVAAGTSTDSARQYLVRETDAGSLLTDYERRSIALLALGIDPRTDTDTNYIDLIIAAFDGAQFGDPDLVNDDIFAIFPLSAVGYGYDTAVVTSTIAFILEQQSTNGSWGSIDLTAAAIQALLLYPDAEGVGSAVERATDYLHSMQMADGSFGGNIDSTSWVIGAINALMPQSTNHTEWLRGENRSPLDYLASVQATDGGMSDPSLPARSRLWSTSYALVAAYERTWTSIIGATPRFRTVDQTTPLSEDTSSVSASGGSSPSVGTTTTILSEVTTSPLASGDTTMTPESTGDTPQDEPTNLSDGDVPREDRFDLVGVPISFGDGKLIYTEDNAPPSLQIAGASYTQETEPTQTETPADIQTSVGDVVIEETVTPSEPESRAYETSSENEMGVISTDDASTRRAKRLFRLSGIAAAILAFYLFRRSKQET